MQTQSLPFSVPCPPTEVKVKMQKSEGDYWAMSSWNDVNCTDVEFQAQLTGRIGNSHETLMEVSGYWLTRKYFEFPIPCSTAFMLTVRARNSAGEGPPSSTIEGTSGKFIILFIPASFSYNWFRWPFYMQFFLHFSFQIENTKTFIVTI